MADTVAIELQDNVSGPAEDAAKALADLKSRIVDDTAALREMQQAMRSLNAAATVDIATFKQLRDSILAKKASIASANQEYIKLGGTFERVQKAASKLDFSGFADAVKGSQGQGKLAGAIIEGLRAHAKRAKPALDELPKPLEEMKPALDAMGPSLENVAKAVKRGGFGGLADQLFDMGEALSTLPGVLIAASSALLLLTAAIVTGFAAAAASFVKFGIGAAAAARDTKLLLATAAKAPGEVAGMMAVIDNVAAVTPVAKAELAKMAVELRKAGVAGKGLEAALLKKATKGSTLAVAAEQSRSLSVQAGRLKENLIGLFSGVKLDPLLNAFRDFVALFDESTQTGRALKTLIESLFNPLIEALGLAGPGANQFFKGMVIGALKVGIAIQLLRIKLKQLTEGVEIEDLSQAFRTAGEFALYAAIGVGVFAAIVAAVIGWVALTTAAIFGLVGVFVLVGFKVAEALFAIPAALMSINNFIVSRVAAMIDAGFQFAAGLADGIRSGISEVINAAIEVASGAVDAVKNKLKMRSPSRVMAELGLNMTAGLAGGVDQGSAQVSAATADAVSIPAQAIAGGGGGGRNITIEAGAIVINAKDTDTATDIAAEALRRLGDLFMNSSESGATPEAA